MTLYRVLRALVPAAEPAAFAEVGRTQATSALAAIRAVVEQRPAEEQPGTYAAVPERSWLEREVGVEQKPRIVLSETTPRPRLAEAPAPEGGSGPARAERRAASEPG